MQNWELSSAEFFGNLARSSEVQLDFMQRNYCRRRVFGNWSQIFCDVKEMVASNPVDLEAMSKLDCSKALIESIDVSPSVNQDALIALKCRRDFNTGQNSSYPKRHMAVTLRGLLIVTDQTLTATDYDGVVHDIFRKSKNNDLSQCIHVDSIKFHYVTFHDDEVILSPYRGSSSITTMLAPQDVNLVFARRMMHIFTRTFHDTEYFISQPLWLPRELREFQQSLLHSLNSYFLSKWYMWDSLLADNLPVWLFWMVRYIPLFLVLLIFLLELFDEFILQSRIKKTISDFVLSPFPIFLEFVMVILFFLFHRYLFLPHELHNWRMGFFFRFVIGV